MERTNSKLQTLPWSHLFCGNYVWPEYEFDAEYQVQGPFGAGDEDF